ncbi:MAG: methyl-accepting chemotaxis protein [Firmicutes bacterium]|nr:methyl-accepting chemotaxis protein [Bacillota bacterium]
MADIGLNFEVQGNMLAVLNKMVDSIDKMINVMESVNNSVSNLGQEFKAVSSIMETVNNSVLQMGNKFENLSKPVAEVQSSIEEVEQPMQNITNMAEEMFVPFEHLGQTFEYLQEDMAHFSEPLQDIASTAESLTNTFEQVAKPIETSTQQATQLRDSFADLINPADILSKKAKEQARQFAQIIENVQTTNQSMADSIFKQKTLKAIESQRNAINEKYAETVKNNVNLTDELLNKLEFSYLVKDKFMQTAQENVQIATQELALHKAIQEQSSLGLAAFQEKMAAAKPWRETLTDIKEGFFQIKSTLKEYKKNLDPLSDKKKTLKDTLKNWNYSLGSIIYKLRDMNDEFDTGQLRVVNTQGVIVKTIDSVDSLSNSAQKVSTEFGGWGALIVTLNNALSLVKGTMQAIKSIALSFTGMAKENMASSLRMANVIRNMTRLSDGQADDIDVARQQYQAMVQHATDFSRATGIGENELNASLSTLAAFTQDLDMSKQLMDPPAGRAGSIADLAVGMSPDLTVDAKTLMSLSEDIANAIQGGHGNQIRRLPIGFTTEEVDFFSDYADMATRAEMVIAGISRQFGGLSRTIGKTPIGVISSAKNEMDNFRASIGNTALTFKASFKAVFLEFAPAIQAGLDSLLARIKQGVIDNMDTIRNVIANAFGVFFTAKQIVINAFGVIKQVIGGVIQFITTLFANMSNFVITNLDMITLAFKLLSLTLAVKFIPVLLKKIALMMLKIKITMLSAAKAVVAWALKLKPIMLIIGAIMLLVATIRHFADDSADAMDFVKGIFFDFLDLVLAVVNKIINTFIGLANFLTGVFRDPIGAVIDLFRTLGSNVLGILEPIASVLDRILGTNLAGTVNNLRNSLNTWADSKLAERGYLPVRQAGEPMFGTVNITRDLPVRQAGGIMGAVSNLRSTFEEGFGFGADVADMFGDAFERFAGFDETDPPAGRAGHALGGLGNHGITNLDNLNRMNFDSQGNLMTANQNEVSIRGENLRMMVDIARREYARQYRTDPTSLQQTNNFNIANVNETADLDEVVDYIVRGAKQAYAANALA